MKDIEYFYAAHSAFAYLGSARLSEIAAAAGRRIVHRPVDLRRVVGAANPVSFRERSPAHVDYYFRREIERWSEHRGVKVKGGIPANHGHDLTLANCSIIAAAAQGLDADRYAHALLRGHWAEHADLGDEAALAGLAREAGLDPAPLLEAARAPEILSAYEANTEEAIARSVFGSPTYFVDGDMFYGQDRLDLVERALQRPYTLRWAG